MIEKLADIEKRYLTLQDEIIQASSGDDHRILIELNKKIAEIQDIYDLYQEYKKFSREISEAKEIMTTETDEEMIDMAKEQIVSAEIKIEEILHDIKIALLPRDPNDDKNVYLEIRPAAGGDEAGLFASELLRMYLFYAQKKGRRTEVVDQVYNDVGGLKFAMIKMSGEKVYSILKFESGVHRVQRIPDTESNGRVHTSTVTVAIMPEVDDVQVHIDANDIIMDTYAASSAGGQNANKNQTGVRLHHKPSGLIVTIGDSKSQLQNKEKAFAVLKARLFQIENDKQQSESRNLRGDQIGGGDRSEKIKTYNFPQDRLTDHRIKQSWSNLPVIMQGEIDDMINTTILENQTRLLQATGG